MHHALVLDEVEATAVDCAADRHRPRRGSEYFDGTARRAVCRRCHCALVRTEATRRWIRSGLLG